MGTKRGLSFLTRIRCVWGINLIFLISGLLVIGRQRVRKFTRMSKVRGYNILVGVPTIKKK